MNPAKLATAQEDRSKTTAELTASQKGVNASQQLVHASQDILNKTQTVTTSRLGEID
jgi:hypothetical protein